VNELKSIGDPGAFNLGPLLRAISVGDDRESMRAQVSETR
jgi:hypothetical protein